MTTRNGLLSIRSLAAGNMKVDLNDPHLGFEVKSAPQTGVEADSSLNTTAPAVSSGKTLTPLMPDQGLGAIGFVSPRIAYVELLGFSSDETALTQMDSAMAAISSAGAPSLLRSRSSLASRQRTES